MVVIAIVLYNVELPTKVVTIIYCIGITIISLSVAKRTKRCKLNQWLTSLGENTLPIYAIHWCLLFSPLWRLNFYTTVFNEWPLIISTFFTTTVWLFICIVMIMLFKKSKVTRVLFLGIR